MLLLTQTPIGPDSPLSLWFLVSAVGILLATALLGWRIVGAIENRLEKYVQRELFEERMRSFQSTLTHIHGCLHEIKGKIEKQYEDRN